MVPWYLTLVVAEDKFDKCVSKGPRDQVFHCKVLISWLRVSGKGHSKNLISWGGGAKICNKIKCLPR